MAAAAATERERRIEYYRKQVEDNRKNGTRKPIKYLPVKLKEKHGV